MTVLELIDKLNKVANKKLLVVTTEQESRGELKPWKVNSVIEWEDCLELSYTEEKDIRLK